MWAVKHYTIVCSNKLIREMELRFESQHETAHAAALLTRPLAQFRRSNPALALAHSLLLDVAFLAVSWGWAVVLLCISNKSSVGAA